MCGIAGIYRLGPGPVTDDARAADRALVGRMLAAIAYRGPDDAGLESPGRVTMGVRRLSILDVAGGHQPLADPGGRVWASQNGELFNYPALRSDLSGRHVLRTGTDTEVLPLLHLERGRDAVAALEGMFAIAVYDTRDESLLLARDAVGIKPLYVAKVGDRLLYASELKALLCDPSIPRTLDRSAIADYLALGFIPGRATPFEAIRKVRPGCRVIATPGGVREERWWRWPRFFSDDAAADLGAEALADDVAARLAAATKSQLLSDRPLGVLLSGGLDSSVMTALLPEDVRRELNTFCIGFEGSGYHDERAHAREVARVLGTRHHEHAVGLDIAHELPRVIGFLDEPCADPAVVPAHLVARAAAAHVTVLLSGTGGDETFGGYRRHRLGALLRRAAWLPARLARAGAAALAERDQHRRTRGGERLVMARKLLEARGRPTFLGAYLSAFEPSGIRRWSEATAAAPDPDEVAARLWGALIADYGTTPQSPEEIAFVTDHLFYLPDDLLLKEDRATMGASVEGRVPFLDAGLVRHAAGLPLASRFRGGRGKQVLRTIARRHLPAWVADRPKHGFSVPVEDWFRGPLDALLHDALGAGSSGLFDAAAVRGWHASHRAGADRAGLLWSVLAFELWWREVGSADAGALASLGRPLAGAA